ncbi:hypothetical protein X757_03650 [Mesorhizobium sp. LSHC414A00]|nr:hypothetical protein X757_03650 [Mesorhizobium sp. LSHC414A00]
MNFALWPVMVSIDFNRGPWTLRRAWQCSLWYARSGPAMLLCSASAAARRSISARESCSEGLFWPLALSIEGVAATRTIILHARPSDKRLAGLT